MFCVQRSDDALVLREARALTPIVCFGVILLAGCIGKSDDQANANGVGTTTRPAAAVQKYSGQPPNPAKPIQSGLPSEAAGAPARGAGDSVENGVGTPAGNQVVTMDDVSRASLQQRCDEISRQALELGEGENFAGTRALLEQRLAIHLRLYAPNSYQVRDSRESIAFVDWAVALSDSDRRLNRKAIELERSASEQNSQGHFQRALELAESARNICRRLRGGGTVGDAVLTEFIGNQYALANDLPHARECFLGAIEIIDGKVGPISPRTVLLRIELAHTYVMGGDFVQAARLFRQAQDESDKLSKADQGWGNLALAWLGTLYWEMGDRKAGEQMLNDAAMSARNPDGRSDNVTASIAMALADCYIRTARYAKAEPLLLEAVRFCDADPRPVNPQRLDARASLGRLYTKMSRYAQAEFILTRSLAESRQLFPDDSPMSWQASQYLGELRAAQKDYSAAEPLLSEAIRSKEKSLGKDSPRLRSPLASYEELLVATGRVDAAREVEHRIAAIDRSLAAMLETLRRK